MDTQTNKWRDGPAPRPRPPQKMRTLEARGKRETKRRISWWGHDFSPGPWGWLSTGLATPRPALRMRSPFGRGPAQKCRETPPPWGRPRRRLCKGSPPARKRQRRSLPTKPGPEPQPQRGLPLQASSAARWPRGLTARADPAQAASRASKRDPGAGLRCPQDSAPPRSASRRDTGIERGVSHPSRFWEEAEATAGVYLRAVSRLGHRPSDSCAAGLTCEGRFLQIQRDLG